MVELLVELLVVVYLQKLVVPMKTHFEVQQHIEVRYFAKLNKQIRSSNKQ